MKELHSGKVSHEMKMMEKRGYYDLRYFDHLKKSDVNVILYLTLDNVFFLEYIVNT